MGGFKDKIARFMYGRYGMDQLSRLISYVCLALLVVTLFMHNNILYFLALIGLIYTYYRAFSKNISKRHAENDAYLKIHYKILGKFNNIKGRAKDSKTHRIFKCPSCGQKIRVPKGKGKISIKCPKCRIEFIKKT